MTNFEKSVKRATKIKVAAPKSKYIESILTATHSGDAGIAEIFRTLQNRLRDSTWTIVFKSLIVVHLMIREGEQDVTLRFLAESPHKLAINSFSEVQSQGSNIQRYSNYLTARSKGFGDTKVDYVRSGPGRLKRLTVDHGLLRETESVQRQIRALLKCDLLTNEPENEISLTAFRLLTMDLLVLYSVMNEGTINVLEHYFEMSRPDSERALKIYKTFSFQTEEVVKFLGVARHFESATRLEIPKLKHASTDLAALLEDDLNDPDFELRRKEYLAQKGSTKNGQLKDAGAPRLAPKLKNKDSNNANKAAPAPNQTPAAAPKRQSKAPDPDLIDFFDSIEQNQQPMNQQPQPQSQPFNNFSSQPPQFQQQQTGFAPQQTGFQQPQQTGFQQPQQTGFQQPQQTGFMQPQQTGYNPFAQPQQQQQQPQQPQPQPLQPTSTGTGFGAYSSTSSPYGFQSNLPSIPQNGATSFTQQRPHTGHQPQTANPFRQSMLPPPEPSSSPQSAPNGGRTTSLTRQSTNPFAKQVSTQSPQFTGGASPFSSPAPQPQQQQQQMQQPQSQLSPAPLQPQRTGTNPFARNSVAPQQQLQPPPASPLQPNPTGSTNPFRQSMFVNQQTGQGWQVSGQQGTMGGYETLDTTPIFPRPGQMA